MEGVLGVHFFFCTFETFNVLLWNNAPSVFPKSSPPNPPQSGLHLLVSKQPLVCLVHHIWLNSSQVLQSHLEWSLWMLLFILAVTLLLAAPVATVLPLLYAPIQNLLLLTKMFLAHSELGLLRLGLIKCRYILILWFFFFLKKTFYDFIQDLCMIL